MPFDGEGQYFSNGKCCDPSDLNDYQGPFTCFDEPPASGENDGLICDPDCGSVDAGCTTIPLDGGLGLLALAGGGLATAAMRRRREEEAEQQA
jgi:hypothetical protein